jgi:hypothetical protein
VDRSAPIPFSSCPVDRNPLADRGSFSITRTPWIERRPSRLSIAGLTPGLRAFKNGSFVADPANANGNGNGGQEYGTALSDEQRWAIIEYLKTL